MPHYVGTLPWHSEERHLSWEEKQHKRAPGHNSTGVRDTVCAKCRKHFRAEDIKKSLCIWCWHDQGIVFDDKKG